MKDAHFHLHASPVRRSKGHSSVAAAAYQSNQRLTHAQQRHGSVAIEFRAELNKGIVSDGLRDALQKQGVRLSADAVAAKGEKRRHWEIRDGEERYQVREYTVRKLDKETGKRKVVEQGLDLFSDRVHDYTRKRDVVETFVAVPDNAPDWAQAIAAKEGAVAAAERERLWNEFEGKDRNRKNRPARQIELSFVRELPYSVNKQLLKAFVAEQLTRKGVVVDVAIHDKEASDGGRNVHAHVLFTTRHFDKEGNFSDKKSHYWNIDERVDEWRQAWADKQNAALAAAGSEWRVSHLSYELRGINQKGGKHLGAVAHHMEQRNIATERGNANRAIAQENGIRRVVDSRKPQLPPRDVASDLVPPLQALVPEEDSSAGGRQHHSVLRRFLRAEESRFGLTRAGIEQMQRLGQLAKTAVSKLHHLLRRRGVPERDYER